MSLNALNKNLILFKKGIFNNPRLYLLISLSRGVFVFSDDVLN